MVVGGTWMKDGTIIAQCVTHRAGRKTTQAREGRAMAKIEARGVRNILAVYHRATLDEIADGHSWYGRAGEVARSMGNSHGTTQAVAAGVISALSPAAGWRQNVEGADRLFHMVRSGEKPTAANLARLPSYNGNRRKAWAIATGKFGSSTMDVAEAFGPGAPKTHAFYWNILGSVRSVCIDGHAVSARDGVRYPIGDPALKAWPAKYKRIAAEYIRASQILGIEAPKVQATVWLAWKRIHETRDTSLPF
jgi:hypothetical protein